MDQKTVFIKVAKQAWQGQVDRATKFINDLTDDQLMKEIASGKNRGVYLMGHLIAVHDAIPEILGIGKRKYPEYKQIFLDSPDKSIAVIPSLGELKQAWSEVHERLKIELDKIPVDGWFARHESMTDEDFEKDPARNKLSVLLGRTNHLSYHFGQLRLLK